jgi:hypothetical protein
MERSKWEVIECGIDYITLTAKTPHSIQKLKLWSDTQFFQQQRLGNKLKPSGPMGYDGFQCGPVFGGARVDGFMLRVSGPTAQQAFMDCCSNDVHTTRIDLQFTARIKPFPEDLAIVLADQTIENRKTLDGKNWSKLHLHKTFGDGDTLNIGKRGCRQFGRVYNKYAESADSSYIDCWRFEVEYKQEMAPLVAAWCKTQEGLCQIGVRAYSQFLAWGVPLPVLFDGDYIAPITIGKHKTDAERKMQWLHKQVAPTIRWLMANGYEDALEDWQTQWYDEDVEVPRMTRELTQVKELEGK